MIEVYLFVEEGCNKCAKARELLAEEGIPFKVVDVSKNGVKGWMLVEFGSMETPMLAGPDAIVVGLENIRKYVEVLKRKLNEGRELGGGSRESKDSDLVRR